MRITWPHWLKCDWDPWSDSYSKQFYANSYDNRTVLRWFQKRTCRKCNKMQVRTP